MDIFTWIEYQYLNILGSKTPLGHFSTLHFWFEQHLFAGYIHFRCTTTPIFQVSLHYWRFSDTTFLVRETRIIWVYLSPRGVRVSYSLPGVPNLYYFSGYRGFFTLWKVPTSIAKNQVLVHFIASSYAQFLHILVFWMQWIPNFETQYLSRMLYNLVVFSYISLWQNTVTSATHDAQHGHKSIPDDIVEYL